MQTSSHYSVGVGPTIAYTSGGSPLLGIGFNGSFGTKTDYSEKKYSIHSSSYTAQSEELFSKIEAYTDSTQNYADLNETMVNTLLTDIKYGRRDAIYLLTRHLDRYVEQKNNMLYLISMKQRAIIESYRRLESTPFGAAWNIVKGGKQ